MLELEDEYILGRFDDAVGTALALLFLREHEIGAEDAEYEVERIVELTLTLLLCVLATHGVGDAGKERRELAAQGSEVGGGKRAHHLRQV